MYDLFVSVVNRMRRGAGTATSAGRESFLATHLAEPARPTSVMRSTSCEGWCVDGYSVKTELGPFGQRREREWRGALKLRSLSSIEAMSGPPEVVKYRRYVPRRYQLRGRDWLGLWCRDPPEEKSRHGNGTGNWYRLVRALILHSKTQVLLPVYPTPISTASVCF